jgi:hypothetical protein
MRIRDDCALGSFVLILSSALLLLVIIMILTSLVL